MQLKQQKMWKIQSKYPFIELMTYLECKQVQTLLYRASKYFRRRLIVSFQQIKNASSEIEEFSTIEANLYFQYRGAIMLFTEEQTLTEILIRESQYINLKVQVYFYDKEKADQLLQLKQIQSTPIFGNVSISLNCYDVNNLQTYLDSLIRIQDFFNQSHSIQLTLFANHMRVSSKLSLEEYGIRNIQFLQIMVSQYIYLSKNSLQQIRELQMISENDYSFNLQFEELSNPFVNTKFSILLSKPQTMFSAIQKAHSQYPDLFEVQSCKIILQYINSIQIDEIQVLLETYQKSTILIQQFTYQCDIDGYIISWECWKQGNALYINEVEYFREYLPELADLINTGRLIIQSGTNISPRVQQKFEQKYRDK